MINQKLAIRLLSLVLCIIMLLGTVGCNLVPTTPTDDTHDHTHEGECAHKWDEATCTKPKTCSLCGETEGEAKGHTGGTATCLAKAVCSVCNEEYGELASHSYNQDEWGFTSPDGHAHLCSTTECHAYEKLISHTPNGPATEKEPSVCVDCGYIIAPALAHTTHIGKPEWKRDDSGHWHDCVGCETEKVDFAEHKFDSDCDKTCDICGYERNVTHKFTVEKVSKEYLATEATCLNAATYYKSCACGAKGTETFASGDALDHNWDKWSVANGKHTRICKRDNTHIETGDCSGGTATCEKPAVCSTCGNEYGVATDHEYGEWQVTVPATCEKAGTRRQTCIHDGCDAYVEEPIAATGHIMDSKVVAPTCSEQGYTLHFCTVEDCEYSYKDTYTEPTGEHVWDIDEPTCEQKKTCLECGEFIDALGHKYEETARTNATCTAAAKVTYTCERCTDSYDQDEGEPLDHDISGLTPTLVLVEGKTCLYVQHYTCKREGCNTDITGETITHHKEYTAKIITAATCVSEGTKELKCTACGHVEETLEIIPVDTVIGHKWDAGTESGGKTVYECLNEGCDEQKEVVSVGKNDTVNVNDVKDAELELEMEDGEKASITLGEAAEAMADKNVNISVTTANKNTLGLNDDQLAQIGDNKVYDFSITEGTNPVIFKGKMLTVTLPYELKSTDNVDNIAVWYIDDNGKLQYFKATYNNGFITFETDHFSYYTVTELTPAERCALYGHSETVKVVAPTCTAEGYTLKFCIRCGNTVKTDVKAALGHNYQLNEDKSVAVTCTTAGKEVKTCANCQKSTTVILRATGHNWTASETVEATCQAAGYSAYTCENGCGIIKKQTIAQLAHNMTSTVVAPNCTETGYTEHKCSNDGCDYSYRNNIQQPIGHKYAYEFVWADDYSSAACNVSCENEGCEFTEKLDIEDITVTDIAPDCDSYGRYEYIARITHNGKVLEDKQSKDYDDKSFKHTYGTKWESDKENHWHVCEECGVVDNDSIAKHTFDDVDYDATGHWAVCSACGYEGEAVKHTLTETERKEPTCVDNGSVKLTCECGYEKTQTLMATGDHNYVNGNCSVCGKEDTGCDHKTLVSKVIDLSEYGICQGSIKVLTCECGELVYIEDEEAIMGCDWDEIDDSFEDGVDENGNMYQKGTMRCGTCGAEMEMYAIGIKDGCNTAVKYSIAITIGETVIFDDLRMEYEQEYHENIEKVLVDFSEYSSCGGYAYKRVCKDCGNVEYLSYDMNIKCEVKEPEPTTFTDENGIVHTIQTATCPKCGLVFTMDFYKVERNVCEWFEYMTMTIKAGDEVIYIATEEDYNESHEEVVTYEKFGDTCEDGYRVIEYCAKCDTTYSWAREGHYTEYTETELDEYGICSGYMSVNTCKVCGTITRANVEIDCRDSQYTSDKFVDENNVTHYVETRACATCKAVYTYERWTVVETECSRYEHRKVTLTVNGESVIDTTYFDHYTNHDYVYSAEKLGETCEDGLTITTTCTKCDYNEVRSTRGCYYVYEEYNLSDFGTCGGNVNITKCISCGDVEHADSYKHCDLRETGKTEDGYTIMTCQWCKAVYHTKRIEGEKNGYCEYTVSVDEILFVNGEQVLAYAYTTNAVQHNYQYTATKLGETCKDGLNIVITCADCSYTDNRTSSGCYSVYTTYDLGDYGIECGGFIEIGECIGCGLAQYTYDNYNCQFEYIDLDGNGKEDDMLTCINCGTQMSRERVIGEKDDKCMYTVKELIVFYVDGEAVFDYGREWRSTSHEYDRTAVLNGTSCIDGVTITEICTDCGDTTDAWITYSHETIREFELDPAEYGFCDYHYAYVEICACGEEVHFDYYINKEYDGTGYIACPDCSFKVYHISERTTDGCNTTIVRKLGFYDGETEIYYNEATRTYQQHNLKAEATFTNGVLNVISNCTECDFVSTFAPESVTLVKNEESGEYYYDVAFTPDRTARYTVYLMADGAVSLRVIRENNAGGKDEDIAYPIEEVFGENILQYDGWMYAGEQYTLRLSFENKAQSGDVSYIIIPDNGCGHVSNNHYVLPEGVESCEDGLLEMVICNKCGQLTDTHTVYYHNTEYTQIDLSEYGFCDYHYIEVSMCPCGQECNFNYYVGGEYQDGYESCKECSFKVLHAENTEQNGCEYVTVTQFGVYNGDEEIYYHEATRSYTEHKLSVNATLIDGVLKTEVACTECDFIVVNDPKTVELVYNEELDQYCYDLSFTPETDGTYLIYSLKEKATRVELYQVVDGEYDFITSTSYDDKYGNFKLSYKLEAGVEYVYRMSYAEANEEGSITYVFTEMSAEHCSHRIEEFYVLPEGVESCEDGLIYMRVCKSCGEIIRTSNENYHYTESIYFDLSQYGLCEHHYIEGYVCPCGQNSEFKWDVYGNCDYQDNMVICLDCGLKVLDNRETLKDGCNYTDVRQFGIYAGETEIYYNETARSYTEHKLAIDASATVGMLNASVTCTECGVASSFAPENVTLNLNEETGEYYYDVPFTPASNGAYYYIYLMSEKTTALEILRVNEDGSYETIYGDKYETVKPEDGSLNTFFRQYTWLNENTEYIFRISFADKTQSGDIAYLIVPENNECSHYTESYYVLPEGFDSCEDGLFTLSACRRCAQVISVYTTNEHRRNYQHFELEGNGNCSGHYAEISICPCGADSYFNHNLYGEYLDGYRTCYNCDVKILDNTETVKNGCIYTDIRHMAIYDGETEVFYTEASKTYTKHNFTVEATAVDGVVNAEIVCIECGLSTTFAPENVTLVKDEETGEYYYDINFVSDKYQEFHFYLTSKDAMTLEIFRVNENGDYESDRWYEGNKEANSKLSILSGYFQMYADEEYVLRIRFKDSTKSGNIAYLIVPTGGDYKHENDVYYVLPNGFDSCEDGLIRLEICRTCGEATYLATEYYHNYTYEIYELSDYGICGGMIENSVCPCGKEGSIYYDFYSCPGMENYEEKTDADGTVHNIRTKICDMCGASWVVDEYTLREGCLDIHYVHITITVDGEAVIDIIGRNGYTEYHEYEYNYVFDNPDATPNCEDGVTINKVCTACDKTVSSHYYYHYTNRVEEYNFSDYGACYGYIRVNECACGQNNSVNTSKCAYNGTSNTQTYEDGTVHYITVYTCSNCGLRYQEDRYTVRDEATCVETTYYTITASKNENFICEVTYEKQKTVHNYTVTATLYEGATSCLDGVTITYACTCGDTYTKEEKSHTLIEVERYNLTDYGALDIHAGVVKKYACACGQKADLDVVDYMCEFGTKSVECWVDGHINGSFYTAQNIYGESLIPYSRQYTCAVTDPEKCNCIYRITTYYLPVEGKCQAEEWEVIQLGYNPADGTFQKEIKVRTGKVATYHNYTVEDMAEQYANGMTKVSGTRYTCPDCGSYYLNASYYYENGIQSAYDRKAENTLDDGQRKLYWERHEYNEDGNYTLEMYKYIDANGVETWNKTEYQYDANGNKILEKYTSLDADGVEYWHQDAWEYIENGSYVYDGMTGEYTKKKHTYTDSNGTNDWSYDERFTTQEYSFQDMLCEYMLDRREDSSGYIHEYVKVYYKNYWFEVLSYTEYSETEWYRSEYTYDFTDGCTRTEHFTNGLGEDYTNGPMDCHPSYSYEIIKNPTCTQDGLEANRCMVCGSVSESYTKGPNGHNWCYVDGKGIYYCVYCGMENTNGADGDVILEDLTDAYGNGENYVAGYYTWLDVEFIHNVSIMLHTPLADGNNQILLEGIEIAQLEGVRALSFSKAAVLAAVEAKAAELGITLTPDMYDVRLAFVPLGADESHDYAVTFTEDNENYDITGNDAVKIKLASGEKQVITVTSDIETYCRINHNSWYEVYADITNANGEYVFNGSFWGCDFYMNAGETYTMELYFYGEYEGNQYAYINISMN